MTNGELIKLAATVVKTRKTKNGLFGDVGCALLSVEGKVYLGVCAASGSNAFCAEQNAIGSMITESSFQISKIVAVWKDENDNTFVIPPCGNCRQLMFDLDEQNLRTEVILDRDVTMTIAELLPHHTSWKRQ